MITPAQVRMARAALGITAAQLATLARIGQATVLRFERDEGVVLTSTLEAIQSALEKKGIIFLASGEQKPGGPGVRLKK